MPARTKANGNLSNASLERFYSVRINRMSPSDAVDLGRTCNSLLEFQVVHRYVFIWCVGNDVIFKCLWRHSCQFKPQKFSIVYFVVHLCPPTFKKFLPPMLLTTKYSRKAKPLWMERNYQQILWKLPFQKTAVCANQVQDTLPAGFPKVLQPVLSFFTLYKRVTFHN